MALNNYKFTLVLRVPVCYTKNWTGFRNTGLESSEYLLTGSTTHCKLQYINS